MTDERKYVMVTTVDSDFHLFDGEIDMFRMKVDHNKWLLTTDGRFVRADKVVSAWVPDEDELRGFLGGES
jgi:hypothetical protein